MKLISQTIKITDIPCLNSIVS